ncbi:hypothetical protein DERF_007897 [Dermatophagoides farinae]|uniref:Uncharacterized protein n=1 Tax=Dermatophagoides farinae TaxID=6954 RepID=A0A922L3P8_DERFA|nr:hypothetical protein DERF_007897 [Dermatophagoides farinae]
MAMLRAVSNSFQTIGTSPSSMDKRESPKTASSGGGGGTQRASVMLSAAKENFTKSLGSKNVMEISPTKADNNNDSSNDDNNVDNLVVQPKKSILRTPSNDNSTLSTKKKRVIFSEPVVSDELVFDCSSPFLLSLVSNAGKQPPTISGVKRSRSNLTSFSIGSIIDDNQPSPSIITTADQEVDMDKTSNNDLNNDIENVDTASNEQNINEDNGSNSSKSNSGNSKRRKLQHQKATLEDNDDGSEYSLRQQSHDDYFQTMFNSSSNSALKNGSHPCSTSESNFDSKPDWITHGYDDYDDDDDNDYDDFYFSASKCITEYQDQRQSFEDKDSNSSNSNDSNEKISSTTKTTITLSGDNDDSEKLTPTTATATTSISPNESNSDANSNEIIDSNELVLLEACAQNEFQPIHQQTTSSQDDLEDMRKYIDSLSNISPIKNTSNESSNNDVIMIADNCCQDDVNVMIDKNESKINNQENDDDDDDEDDEMVNIKIPLKLARKFSNYLITYIKMHDDEKKKTKLSSDDQSKPQQQQ